MRHAADLLLVRRQLARAVLERLWCGVSTEARARIAACVDALEDAVRAGASTERLAELDLAVMAAILAATESALLQLGLQPIASILAHAPALSDAISSIQHQARAPWALAMIAPRTIASALERARARAPAPARRAPRRLADWSTTSSSSLRHTPAGSSACATQRARWWTGAIRAPSGCATSACSRATTSSCSCAWSARWPGTSSRRGVGERPRQHVRRLRRVVRTAARDAARDRRALARPVATRSLTASSIGRPTPSPARPGREGRGRMVARPRRVARADARGTPDRARCAHRSGLPRDEPRPARPIERITWKIFQKCFHRDAPDAPLRGWNVRLEQRGVRAPSFFTLERDAPIDHVPAR